MDPGHFEAALCGDVNMFPFCEIQSLNLIETFNKVSPSGNSLLHVASSSGHEDMTKLIAHKFPFLITKQNSEGNTALHLAVRAHKLNTVKALVQFSKEISNSSTFTYTFIYTLLTMKNAEGNTALHEALFALHASKKNVNILDSIRWWLYCVWAVALVFFFLDGAWWLLVCFFFLVYVALYRFFAVQKKKKREKHVEILVKVARSLVFNYPDVAFLQNKAGKSPLCMAVESGNEAIVKYILNALPDQSDGLLQRLQGKSPVHVAIEKGMSGMLRIIWEKKKELLLLRDEEGNTPLHFAAYIGCRKGVHDLLEFKSDWAFERNNKGYYPLHLACENGHIKVTEMLFQKWPDPTELLCNKGQNILHAAVKSGKYKMVTYLLKRKGADNLVNKMDRNGNTPSHLAALLGHSMAFYILQCYKRSDVDALNCQGLTAYDIFKANILTKVQDHEIDDVHDRKLKASGVEENSMEVDLKKSRKLKKFQMMMVYSILYIYHEHVRRLWVIIRHHHHSYTKTSHIKIKSPAPKKDLNSAINYLFVVAALVVGAAFSGALHSPFDGSNDASSYSSDVKKEYKHDFLLTIIVSMNLAVIAAFSLFLALLLDANLGSILVSVSFLLLELSLTYMGSAFLSAMMFRIKVDEDLMFLSTGITVLTLYQNIQKALVITSVVVFTLGRKASAIIIYSSLFGYYLILYTLWSIIPFTRLKTFIKFVIYPSFFLVLLFFVIYV